MEKGLFADSPGVLSDLMRVGPQYKDNSFPASRRKTGSFFWIDLCGENYKSTDIKENLSNLSKKYNGIHYSNKIDKQMNQNFMY